MIQLLVCNIVNSSAKTLFIFVLTAVVWYSASFLETMADKNYQALEYHQIITVVYQCLAYIKIFNNERQSQQFQPYLCVPIHQTSKTTSFHSGMHPGLSQVHSNLGVHVLKHCHPRCSTKPAAILQHYLLHQPFGTLLIFLANPAAWYCRNTELRITETVVSPSSPLCSQVLLRIQHKMDENHRRKFKPNNILTLNIIKKDTRHEVYPPMWGQRAVPCATRPFDLRSAIQASQSAASDWSSFHSSWTSPTTTVSPYTGTVLYCVQTQVWHQFVVSNILLQHRFCSHGAIYQFLAISRPSQNIMQ